MKMPRNPRFIRLIFQIHLRAYHLSLITDHRSPITDH